MKDLMHFSGKLISDELMFDGKTEFKLYPKTLQHIEHTTLDIVGFDIIANENHIGTAYSPFFDQTELISECIRPGYQVSFIGFDSCVQGMARFAIVST